MTYRTASLASLLLLATLAADVRRARAEDIVLPFQVSDRSYALRLVKDFETAAKEGDWSKAVDRLQELLDVPASDPVVIRAAGSALSARFEGAVVVARRLFNSLPPEGVVEWERTSRRRAEDLLARGLRLRREQDLREVTRRYPAPDILRRAHDALAQLALVRGDLAAAQFQLESLCDATLPADRAEVLARMAVVGAQTGDAEALARVRELAAPLSEVPVPSGRGTESLGVLVERMAKGAATQTVSASGGRQFGGDAHGSGLSETPPQPDAPRWTIRTEFSEGSENDRDNSSLMQDQRRRLRPVVPVVAQGTVFVNNGLSLIAVDLTSGRPSWRADTAVQFAEWRDSFAAVHTAAVADGVVYAAFTSRLEAGDPGFDRTFYGKTIVYALPHRCLHAFDARTGELLWSHETSQLAGREDAAEVDKECVSSPPLVVGDDVIVSTWTYEGIYDVRLVCYDRRTGRTRWRTSLVQGQQELNLFGRAVKELTTSALAEHGGRVYLATGLGVAAAVEREDGRVAWLSAYPETPIPPATRWYETRDRNVTWCPSPVSATADGVVMAPPDSPDLVAFDPKTGTHKWRHAWLAGRPSSESRRREPIYDREHVYHWFLGATGGRAYVLGNRLAAYDVATGNPSWAMPEAGRLALARLPATDEAAGRAILTKDRIYVPTESAIVVISAATGACERMDPLVPSNRKADPVTGDLVVGDGALLFVNEGRIDASFRFEDQRTRLEALLAANPDDPQVRLEAGLAFAATGRLDEAVTTLEGGLAQVGGLAPRVRDRVEGVLRRALYDTRLARSVERSQTGDSEGAAADLRAAALIARDKGDAVRALFQLAELSAAAGRAADADAALSRIATEFKDVVTSPHAGEPAQSAGALALFRLAELSFAAGRTSEAVARWLDLLEQRGNDDLGATDAATAVRARLEEVAKTDGTLVTTAVHARAKKALDAARAAGDASALGAVTRLYPDPQIAGESALLAAQLHLAAGRPRDAVGVLNTLLKDRLEPAVSARALWKLAEAYRAMDETALERAALRRLAADAPREIVDGAATAAEAAQRELASSRFLVVEAPLCDPRPPLTLLWQSGAADQLPPQVLRLAGSEPRELEGRILLVGLGVIQAVDASNGKQAWQQVVRLEVRAQAGTPGAIVLAGDDASSRQRSLSVVALSASDGHPLWNVRLPGRYVGSETSLGVMYLLHNEGASGRLSHTLTAVSLASGDVLATRSLGVQMRPAFVVAEDAVVLVANSPGTQVRRSLVVLDATTLSPRGRVDMKAPSAPFYVHPALSSVVVTGDGTTDLVAVDVIRGEKAWQPAARLPARRSVKALFAVSGGVIVSDDGDAIRRLAADTGREEWAKELGAAGTLVYEGEAAEGDLIVATLKPRDGSASAVAVALDARTGAERWRTRLPLADENTYPHPKICASVVVYELDERLDRSTLRSHLLVLDRASGAIVQEIEHPTIGRTYPNKVYGPSWIALSSTNELAVYGKASEAK